MCIGVIVYEAYYLEHAFSAQWLLPLLFGFEKIGKSTFVFGYSKEGAIGTPNLQTKPHL